MDGHFAATTQRHAPDGGHHRHVGVTQLQHGLLQMLLGVFHCADTHHHKSGQHGLQVSTYAEGLVTRPDHHTLEVLLGHVHRQRQAFGHVGADGVHLGLEAGDQHLVVECPQADGVIFKQRLACGGEVLCLAAQHGFGEVLARVHGQHMARLEHTGGRIPRTLRRVYTTGLGHGAVKHPVGQRCGAQGLACVNVFLNHLRHVEPTGFLPQLERALRHPKAPAHRKVHVTCRLGNAGQVHGSVVKAVAQNGPEEAALWAFAVAQQLEALGSGLLQHAAIDFVGLLTARHIVLGIQVKTQHVAADLFVETGAGLLAQVAHFQQGLEHGWCAKTRVERVGLLVQVVLQRLDDVGHGVQAHHVGGAEGARAGAAQLFASEVVHHVVGQAKVFHLFHRRQHARDTHTVGDEIGRVLGAHHAFTQAAGDKSFEVVEDVGVGGRCVDQLHQEHVAGWVKEVDAAEARFDFLGQCLAQFGDGQARGVGRHDGVRCHEGCDLFVQIKFPVHTLGNGLDDEVAVFQLRHVFFVVGLLDE